jgi:hypothetical protein
VASRIIEPLGNEIVRGGKRRVERRSLLVKGSVFTRNGVWRVERVEREVIDFLPIGREYIITRSE